MQAWQTFLREVLGRPEESVKLVVPAAVYAFQNNILYEALTYLDSVTYQVTYQLKILTTALFSVLVLGRALHPRQWVALVMLTLGVTIVQVCSLLASGASNRLGSVAMLFLRSCLSGLG